MTELGITMLEMPIPQNAPSPIVVTCSGILIDSNNPHREKALVPIVAKEEPKDTLVSDLQLAKAELPMEVTASGITMLDRPELIKAWSPMA